MSWITDGVKRLPQSVKNQLVRELMKQAGFKTKEFLGTLDPETKMEVIEWAKSQTMNLRKEG